MAIVEIGKSARSDTSAQAVKGALSGIFFVIDTPCFRSKFTSCRRTQASDEVLPDLPGSGLIALPKFFNPPCHWLICFGRHRGCLVTDDVAADLSTGRAHEC